MKLYLYIHFLFTYLFLKINSTLYISMDLIKVDDCLTRIYNENNVTYFENETNSQICDPQNSSYPSPILSKTPYEIGEKIYVDIYDRGLGAGFFSMTVFISGYIIKTEEQKYWTCTDCGGEDSNYRFNSKYNRFDFYNNTLDTHIIRTRRYFHFYFQIPLSDKDEFIKPNINDNYYTLTTKTNFYISPKSLEDEIELINFNTSENLKADNTEIPDTFYKEIGFKIYFDEYTLFEGEFIGLDTSNNDVNLNNNDIFLVSETKGLRYKFSEKEKENKGAYLKFRIEGVTSPSDLSLSKSITKKEDFNFFICLNEYKFCDLGPSMKCLNEGYYYDSESEKYYSCYETCGICDKYKKPQKANYYQNYCDTCNSNNPFYINIKEHDDEDGTEISYKNCYKECPSNMPYLKGESNECTSECPKFKTNNNTCIEYCDSNNFKYLLKAENTCYNYVPKKYKIYVDNYEEKYTDDLNYAVIKIAEECPDDSYDSSFNNICIKTFQDIFYLINPLDLIKYNNPQIIWIKGRTILFRVYTSDIQIDKIVTNSGGHYSIIDISKCEKILKEYYKISPDKSLLIYDINDLTNDNYEYKLYSLEGNELNINICLNKGIILCNIGFYLSGNGDECLKCPVKCSECSFDSVNQNLCLKCNNDLSYYKIYPASINNIPFLECVNEDIKPENFHLNKELLRYEPCFETCKECFDYGNSEINNCTTCISGYTKRDENQNNCVVDCEFYYYYNEYGQYRCTENDICPGGMYLVKDKKKCINNCKDNSPFIYQFKGECIQECPDYTIIKDGNCIYNDIGECALIRENLDIDLYALIDENGQETDQIVLKYALEHQNLNYEIYNYVNKMYNFIIYKNEDCLNKYLNQERITITKIDLKICYNLLMEYYGFPERNIIVTLIDIYRQYQSPYTYYNFYHPETGVKLDAKNICYNSKVSKIFKVLSFDMDDKEAKKNLLSQGVDLFNSSSRFFSDLCYQYDSPNGKDIPLKERVSFFYPNIKICDEGCISKGINYEKYEAECECTFINIINNKLINNAFTGEIVEIYHEMNIEVFKCYKDIFKFNYFIKNYGSIIILILLITQIILNFIYFYKNVFQIRKFTLGLINSYFFELNKKNSNDNNTNIIISKNDDEVHNDNLIISNPPIRKTKKYSSQDPKSNIKISLSPNQKIVEKISSNEHIKVNDNNKNSTAKFYSFNKISMNKFNDKEDIIDSKYILPDGELENYLMKSPEELDFDEALVEDKRKFCEMYKDILLSKHIFLSNIFEEDKFKPRSLKYIVYLLSLNLYFVINALFFSESYIGELYREEKEEKFFSFIPRSIKRIIYAFLVGAIVNFLFDFIIISGNKIKRLLNKRKDFNSVIIKGEIGKILFNIEKSVNIFFIINYIIMLVSWYYISCFNNVYSNTKIEWLKSSVFIIIIMQLIPFFSSLIFALLRFISLRCQIEQIYKIINAYG